MERSMQSVTASTIMIALMINPVAAIEVGDIFFISNGTGNTVTSILKRDKESVELVAQSLPANAEEYCERYEQLKPRSAKMRACIKQNISEPQIFKINCRTQTIVSFSGTFRPGEPGGPWQSVSNPNWIMKGDDLFEQTCNSK